jgi:hypothetical protein
MPLLECVFQQFPAGLPILKWVYLKRHVCLSGYCRIRIRRINYATPGITCSTNLFTRAVEIEFHLPSKTVHAEIGAGFSMVEFVMAIDITCG